MPRLAAFARRNPSLLLAGLALGLLTLGRLEPALAPYAPWAAAGVMAAALVLIHGRDRVARQAARAAIFDDCLSLFESVQARQQDGGGYPVLEGRYLGHEIRLEPVLDHLAWRKLPSLWLKATLLAPTAYAGVLDLIARPQGAEFYSPSGELPIRLPTPADWPAEVTVCADDQDASPPLDRIAQHMSLFEDPQMKELLVTPRGVRLVRQVWQGQRAEYLVLRQAKFPQSRLDPGVVSSLLKALTALSETMAPPGPPGVARAAA